MAMADKRDNNAEKEREVVVASDWAGLVSPVFDCILLVPHHLFDKNCTVFIFSLNYRLSLRLLPPIMINSLILMLGS